MPHINRIRVNNVKYNFGTQFYDDFMMRFSGKNSIYDLANGGGKSVLMLLLFQNLIPNCTLDEKQPIEKLFRTGEGSKTIHSLIEWNLSDTHIQENYKYMLTGFCARKAKDTEGENRENASIEYFNYVIFYREFNDNDIKNLPLDNGKERVTYQGLKNYLRGLEGKDMSLKVHIFERKGDYQRFISDYGLYESEWEIIRGINKTEGHVRTYFETNYKTTRKVVEDLLIEEIIQKSFENKYGSAGGDSMAKTLLEIKDKLLELSEKKSQMDNFSRQQEMIDSFLQRLKSLRQLYVQKEELEEEIAKAYHSADSMETGYEAKKEELEQKIQAAMTDAVEYMRQAETVLVKESEKEEQKLNDQLKELGKEQENWKEQSENALAELHFAESGNDYIDYLKYKMERETIKELLATASGDGNELDGRLKECAAELFVLNESYTKELQEHRDNLSLTLSREKERLEELDSELLELKEKLAVCVYREENESKRNASLVAQVQEVLGEHSMFLKQSVKARQNACEEKLTRLTNTREQLEEKIAELTDALGKTKLLYNEKEALRQIQRARYEELLAKGKERQEKQERYERIRQVYKEQKIEATYQNVIAQMYEKKQHLDSVKKELAALEKKRSMKNSENLDNVIQYLERYYGEIAVAGTEYLAEKTPEEKEELLSRIPFLPYALIVREKFQTLMEDLKLMALCQEEDFCLLLREEAITDNLDVLSASNVIVSTRGKEYFVSEKAQEIRKARLQEEGEQLENSLLRMKEYEEVIREDYMFLLNYQGNEEERDATQTAQVLEELEQELERLAKKITELTTELEQVQGKLEPARVEEIQAREEATGLETALLQAEEAEALAESLERLQGQKEVILKQQRDKEATRNALANQSASHEAQLTELNQTIEEIKHSWEENYSIYYDGNRVEKVSGSRDQVLAKMQGLVQAKNGSQGDVSDKEALRKHYETSMKKALEAIRYRGTSVEELEKAYQEHRLHVADGEELNSKKEECKKLQVAGENLLREMDDVRSKRDKLEGEIDHRIHYLTEKYGRFDTQGLENVNPAEFAENAKAAAKKENEKAKALEQEKKELEKSASRQVYVKENLERMIRSSGISVDKYRGLLPENVDIFARTKELSGQFDELTKHVYRRKDEFRQDKEMLVDMITKLGGEMLAEEMAANLVLPEDTEETDDLAKRLEETNHLMDLEKERIGKGIEDMEKLKENFESQCVQSCVKIRSELEKLPNLSKVTMDGESISMIDLRIPYVDEKMYAERMSAYIDETAREADELEKLEDKLRYVRSRLTWKKMFSVIVTDMNGIRLKLYKRERIVENSRFLPYEEAVGSTGQSQGIYIQFLVSIINYISSVNSRGVDAAKLKKVIFIDNPFGAAKDVYIWEPIFELLRTNNVQLIVPARGATPAITGRFDVNYILGQKFIGGKQQTVVVDYVSNVDNSAMEYTTLSYEQTSMF